MSPPKDPIKYAEWIKNLSISHSNNQKVIDNCRSLAKKQRGIPLSIEHRKNISEEHKNNLQIMTQITELGKSLKGIPRPLEVCEKMSKGKLGKYIGENNHFYGKTHSVEMRNIRSLEKMGVHPTYETRKKMSLTRLGITEDDWVGFAKEGKYCGIWTDPIIKVRKRVRARFDDKCIVCGNTYEQYKKHMHVHHVYRKKDACCNGEKSDWLFATLCNHCHGKYGHNDAGLLKIREILAIEYGNKCMLSLKEYNDLYPDGSEGDKQWGSANGR